MLIKGIILSLSADDNNCVVELPTFENVSGDKATATAVFAIPSGVSNGYKVGDVVIVGFELEKLNKPIVLGKLYTGTEAESSDTGAVKCNTLRVSNSATLPGSTQLTFGETTTDSFKKYSSIADIVSALNATTAKVDGISASGINKRKSLNVKFNRQEYIIEVHLNGFDYDDVGDKIYLYKSTRRKTKVGYSHPANLAKNDGEQAGMGYGIFAGKKRGAVDSGQMDTFPEIPSWMSNNGLIQTEWTLSAENVKEGLIRIPIRKEWNALVCPSADVTPIWCNILGSGNAGTVGATTSSISTKRGLMKIKFAFWDKRTGEVSGLSSSTFKFGVRLQPANPSDLVDSAGNLRSDKLHTSVD